MRIINARNRHSSSIEKNDSKKYLQYNLHIPYVEQGSNPMSNYVNQRERIDDAFVSAVSI